MELILTSRDAACTNSVLVSNKPSNKLHNNQHHRFGTKIATIKLSPILGSGSTVQVSRLTLSTLIVAGGIAWPAWSHEPPSEFAALVSMQKRPAGTFYVEASLDGHNGALDLLVDTGSSFMVLNENLLEDLKAHGAARYVDDIDGVMADGTHRFIPVYRVTALRIGDACWVHDVEAAIFPGDARPILGMSVLERLAPFTLSTAPATLGLNQCRKVPGRDEKGPSASSLSPTAPENIEGDYRQLGAR